MRQLAPDIELHGTVGGLTEGSVWRGPEQVSKHDWVRDALGVPSGADDQAAGSRE